MDVRLGESRDSRNISTKFICPFYLSQRLNSSHLTLRDREEENVARKEERTDAGRNDGRKEGRSGDKRGEISIANKVHTLWFIRDTYIRDIYKFPKRIRDISYACQKN